MIRTPFIIKKAVVTEQSMHYAQTGVFTFLVSQTATKHQIRRAVERLWNVHVTRVSTSRIPGKTRRVGKKRMLVRAPDRKKAFVRLQSGETIADFSLQKT